MENILDKETMALAFATEKHKGKYRKGKAKKEYIVHPISVANLIKIYHKNTDNIEPLVIASYLHDTIEDTNTTYEELITLFGSKVTSLVEELTSDKSVQKSIGKAKYLALKMTNMSDEALELKLCDRYDNVCGLFDTDLDFIVKKTDETIYILNYLLDNRKLNKIHLTILNDIIFVLNTLSMCFTNEVIEQSIDSKKIIKRVASAKN